MSYKPNRCQVASSVAPVTHNPSGGCWLTGDSMMPLVSFCWEVAHFWNHKKWAVCKGWLICTQHIKMFMLLLLNNALPEEPSTLYLFSYSSAWLLLAGWLVGCLRKVSLDNLTWFKMKSRTGWKFLEWYDIFLGFLCCVAELGQCSCHHCHPELMIPMYDIWKKLHINSCFNFGSDAHCLTCVGKTSM